MKGRTLAGFLILSYTFVFSGCGGGGGGPSTVSIAVTDDSPILSNLSSATVTAHFGPSAAGGTANFSIASFTNVSGAGSARLSSPTAPIDSNGNAAVRVIRNGWSNVTVTATSGNFVGRSDTIFFIPQPNKSIVHVSLNKSVARVANVTLNIFKNITSAKLDATTPIQVGSAFASLGSNTVPSATPTSNVSDFVTWFILVDNVSVSSGQEILTVLYNPVTNNVPIFTLDVSQPNKLFTYTGTVPTFQTFSTSLIPADVTLKTDYFVPGHSAPAATKVH